MTKIKLSKDGKYRIGRRVVIKTGEIWKYKTTNRLVNEITSKDLIPGKLGKLIDDTYGVIFGNWSSVPKRVWCNECKDNVPAPHGHLKNIC